MINSTEKEKVSLARPPGTYDLQNSFEDFSDIVYREVERRKLIILKDSAVSPEDLAQELFMCLPKIANSFDAKKGNGCIRSYVHSLIRYRVVDVTRTNARCGFTGCGRNTVKNETMMSGSTVLAESESGRTVTIVDAQVARDGGFPFELYDHLSYGMEGRTKEIFRLRFFYRMTMKEIGKKIGVTEARISHLMPSVIKHAKLNFRRLD